MIQFELETAPPNPKLGFHTTRRFLDAEDSSEDIEAWVRFARIFQENEQLLLNMKERSVATSTREALEELTTDVMQIYTMAAEEGLRKRRKPRSPRVKHQLPWLTEEIRTQIDHV